MGSRVTFKVKDNSRLAKWGKGKEVKHKEKKSVQSMLES